MYGPPNGRRRDQLVLVGRGSEDQRVEVGVRRGVVPRRVAEEDGALSRLLRDVEVEEAPVTRLLAPRPVVGPEEGAVVVEQVGLACGRVRAAEVELAGELAVRVLRGGRTDRHRDRHNDVLAAAVQDDRAVVHAVRSVSRDVHRCRERTARDRGRGHPRPVDVVVEVDPDLEVRDRDRRRTGRCAEAEEDAVRRAFRRIPDERLQCVRPCPVVHEADVLALVHLGRGEVEVGIAVDVRALRYAPCGRRRRRGRNPSRGCRRG